MKDYNLYFFHLRLTLDATAEEVVAAYNEEAAKLPGYPANKVRERQLVLEGALEVLSSPKNRALYHDERWKACVFADSMRTILKACRMWPLPFYPRRPGPVPDSFEGLSLLKSLSNDW